MYIVYNLFRCILCKRAYMEQKLATTIDKQHSFQKDNYVFLSTLRSTKPWLQLLNNWSRKDLSRHGSTFSDIKVSLRLSLTQCSHRYIP